MTNEEKQETKKEKAASKDNSELAHTVREGAIAANIWRRQSQTGFPYYEYSLSRSWMSVSSGKKGYRSNFFSKNEADLMKVIQGATKWILEKEVQAAQAVPLAA